MSKLKKFVKSPHVQIALVTGICIIVLAYFSKKILPQPIKYLPAAIPPFMMVIFESIKDKYKDKKFAEVKYWNIAVIVSTALVIILTWYEII
ncbi:MAG: hypothetical protein SCALA702_21450 [Melioribacteraceae bacterium]|nr:MAG: hypothetical protein SCALA702_21450 [Melioribacteraceae bacterium]